MIFRENIVVKEKTCDGIKYDARNKEQKTTTFEKAARKNKVAIFIMLLLSGFLFSKYEMHSVKIEKDFNHSVAFYNQKSNIIKNFEELKNFNDVSWNDFNTKNKNVFGNNNIEIYKVINNIYSITTSPFKSNLFANNNDYIKGKIIIFVHDNLSGNFFYTKNQEIAYNEMKKNIENIEKKQDKKITDNVNYALSISMQNFINLEKEEKLKDPQGYSYSQDVYNALSSVKDKNDPNELKILNDRIISYYNQKDIVKYLKNTGQDDIMNNNAISNDEINAISK